MNKKLFVGLIAAIILAGVVFIAWISLGSREATAYDYDLSKYVKTGEYKDLPYYKEEAEVTEEDIKNEIDIRLKRASKTENIKEGVVETGDTINVAYVGTIDGVAFEGGTTESSDITIGTTNMIDGFVEGLIGKNVGEKVTLNLKFPDDYHAQDLAGKDCVFEVTINSKKVTTTPELDEEFVKDNSDLKTVEEYKALVKEEILKRKQDNIDKMMKDELWSYILKNSEAIEYPEKELAEAAKKADTLEEQYKQQAASYGLEWEEFLKQAMKSDLEGFKTIKETYAKNIVLNEMVMYSLCRSENIKISNSEYNKELEEILNGSGYTKKSFEEAFGQSIEKFAESNNWKNTMLLDKLLDKVIDLGKEVSKDEYKSIVEKRNAEDAANQDKESSENSQG